MRGDDGLDRFPFLRRRGDVALIALSTGVATGPFMATGRLGDRQLSRFAEMLDQTRDAFRVVLIHHPPQSPLRRYLRRLIDAPALRRRACRNKAPSFCCMATIIGAPLVWLDGPNGTKIPAVGVPSASAAAPHGDEDAAGYIICSRSTAPPSTWRCEMIARQRGADGIIREVERKILV